MISLKTFFYKWLRKSHVVQIAAWKKHIYVFNFGFVLLHSDKLLVKEIFFWILAGPVKDYLIQIQEVHS